MKQSHRRPIEADYIPLARWCLTAQELEAKAKEDVLAAKRACASLMNGVKVTEFNFRVDDVTYHARLERPFATKVNVRKLYVLLGSGEITLDEFLDCITASEIAVEETIGRDKLNRVKETYKKGLDLIIEAEG